MVNIYQEIIRPINYFGNTISGLVAEINLVLVKSLEENRQRVYLGLSDGTRNIKVNKGQFSILNIGYSADDVSNPPTNTECIAAFGAVATTGKGFIGFIDDGDAHTDTYLIVNDGTKYWQTTLTACV